MDTTARVIEEFNESTGTFFVDHSEYKKAALLILFWKDHDLDDNNPNAPLHTLGTELSSVRDLFKEELHFNTTTYGIPSQNCVWHLRAFLNDFLLQHASQESVLLVVYYAGHSDEDSNGECRFAA